MHGAALFLDRDGTLIYDKHYLSDPAGVEVIPGVPEALERARKLGFKLFLFTNQSGVGRGYYTLDDVNRVNERMEALIGLSNPLFAGVGIAPETPDDPQVYRKPSPRFILEMIERDGLDPKKCYMVGDSPADLLAAVNAGIQPIGVATGKGDHPETFPEVDHHKVPVFPDLLAFVLSLEGVTGE